MAQEKPIADWERPLFDAMRSGVAGKDPNGFIPGLAPQFPFEAFKEEMAPADLLQRYMYGASFNISGLRSGYTGPGTKSFLLPDTATATCDLRVISEVGAQDIIAIIRRHLDLAGVLDIAIRVMAAYDWYETSVESSLIRATLATLDAYDCPRTIRCRVSAALGRISPRSSASPHCRAALRAMARAWRPAMSSWWSRAMSI
ncbi:hypothetical protein NWE53_12980 [Bosea sp. NBC_00550]|nr:hypothetical protein [Bosea sp. NBC_00550]UZF95000.1 hypothetical protein NWE53_12980 [Bosea sp. NBC_00550]